MFHPRPQNSGGCVRGTVSRNSVRSWANPPSGTLEIVSFLLKSSIGWCHDQTKNWTSIYNQISVFDNTTKNVFTVHRLFFWGEKTWSSLLLILSKNLQLLAVARPCQRADLRNRFPLVRLRAAMPAFESIWVQYEEVYISEPSHRRNQH